MIWILVWLIVGVLTAARVTYYDGELRVSDFGSIVGIVVLGPMFFVVVCVDRIVRRNTRLLWRRRGGKEQPSE